MQSWSPRGIPHASAFLEETRQASHDTISADCEILADNGDVIPALDGDTRRRYVTEIATE